MTVIISFKQMPGKQRPGVKKGSVIRNIFNYCKMIKSVYIIFSSMTLIRCLVTEM